MRCDLQRFRVREHSVARKLEAISRFRRMGKEGTVITVTSDDEQALGVSLAPDSVEPELLTFSWQVSRLFEALNGVNGAWE